MTFTSKYRKKTSNIEKFVKSAEFLFDLLINPGLRFFQIQHHAKMMRHIGFYHSGCVTFFTLLTPTSASFLKK